MAPSCLPCVVASLYHESTDFWGQFSGKSAGPRERFAGLFCPARSEAKLGAVVELSRLIGDGHLLTAA